MSLYLGTSAGNKILHITNGINTVAEMKSGIRSNSIFHSNLGYVFTKYYNAVYSGYYTASSYYYHVYEIPVAFFSAIVGTTKGYTILLDKNAQMSQLNANTSGLLTNEPYSPVYFRSNATSGAASSTSINSQYRYLHFATVSATPAYSDVTLCVALLDDTGYLTPVSDGTADITITDSNFKINGVTLNNYGYISPAQVNIRDVYTSASAAEDGGIQFINSHLVNPLSFGIRSNTGYSAIESDGHAMFSTAAGASYNRYDRTVLTEFAYGSLYVCGPGGDGSTARTIATGMVTNQLFTCRKTSISSSSTVALNEYLQFYAFTPGTSITINRTYVGYPAYAWTYTYLDMNADMSLSVRLRFTVGGAGCGRSTYASVKTNIMSI